MTALEPWAIRTPLHGIYPYSVTTVALNTDVQLLVASKDMVRDATAKAVFRSLIAIVTLIKVRLFAQLQPLHPLTNDRTRTS